MPGKDKIRGLDDAARNKIHGHGEGNNGHVTDNVGTETYGKDLPEPVIVIDEDDCVEKAPDGGWGWLIVVGSVLMHCLMGKTLI